MATHSSILAWRIPRTGEPGGLPSMGLHRVGHDWSDLAAAAVPYTKKKAWFTDLSENVWRSGIRCGFYNILALHIGFSWLQIGTGSPWIVLIFELLSTELQKFWTLCLYMTTSILTFQARALGFILSGSLGSHAFILNRWQWAENGMCLLS